MDNPKPRSTLMKLRHGLALCLALAASPALSNPLSVTTQVARITGYENGGCFLSGGTPPADGFERLCVEYSWVLNNSAATPMRSVEISNDFAPLVSRYDTEKGPARIVDLRASETTGMRAESFHEQILVAVADYIPAGGSAALRIRVEIERPKG